MATSITTTRGVKIEIKQVGSIVPFVKIDITCSNLLKLRNLVIKRKNYAGVETDIYSGTPDTSVFSFVDVGTDYGRKYTYLFSYQLWGTVDVVTPGLSYWQAFYTLNHLVQSSDGKTLSIQAGYNSGTAEMKGTALNFFTTNGGMLDFFITNGNVKKSYSDSYTKYNQSKVYLKGQKVDYGDTAYEAIKGVMYPELPKFFYENYLGQQFEYDVFEESIIDGTGSVFYSYDKLKNKKLFLTLNTTYRRQGRYDGMKNCIVFTKQKIYKDQYDEPYIIEYKYKFKTVVFNFWKQPPNAEFWKAIPFPTYPQTNDCVQFYLDTEGTKGFNERGLTAYDFERFYLNDGKLSDRKTFRDSAEGHHTYLNRRYTGGIWETGISQKDKKSAIWKADSGGYLKIQLRNGAKIKVIGQNGTDDIVTKVMKQLYSETASLAFTVSGEPEILTPTGEATGVILNRDGYGLRIYKNASENSVTLNYANTSYTPNISLIPVQNKEEPVVYESDTGKVGVFEFSILVKGMALANRCKRLAKDGIVFVYVPSAWGRHFEAGTYGFLNCNIERIKRSENYIVTFSQMQKINEPITEAGLWTYDKIKEREEYYKDIENEFVDYSQLESGWF